MLLSYPHLLLDLLSPTKSISLGTHTRHLTTILSCFPFLPEATT